MKLNQLIILIIFLFIIACDKSTNPPPTTTNNNKRLIGIVSEITEGQLLDSVLIGFKNPAIEDSLIFIDDSLKMDIPNSFLFTEYSKNGYFEFNFEENEQPSYNLMFAYKPGMRLWRYVKRLRIDSVFKVNSQTDSITINMVINDCYNKPEWNEISLNNYLLMSFPKSYGCSDAIFQGDDTWIFYKIRNDGKVEFYFEVGYGTPYVPQEFLYLPTPESYHYQDRILFFVGSDSAAFYFKSTAYSFRNRKGVVLVKNEDRSKYIEVVFCWYSSSEIDEIVQILNTIRYK